jgi:hypothetical protein
LPFDLLTIHKFSCGIKNFRTKSVDDFLRILYKEMDILLLLHFFYKSSLLHLLTWLNDPIGLSTCLFGLMELPSVTSLPMVLGGDQCIAGSKQYRRERNYPDFNQTSKQNEKEKTRRQ